MIRKFLIAGVAAIFTTLATTPAAVAQGYPRKPIKLVVPFAPGGTTDIVARVVAGNIAPHLGQTMIVENKAGGGGVIGATETARAARDGYSLGVTTVSTIATVPAVQRNVPYNPLTDFTPIINMAATPNIISVHPSFPAKEYNGFHEEIKKNPEKYSFASTGYGSITHLLMELFMSISGTKMTHLAYKGAGPALNDVVGGQVPIILDNLPSSLTFIKAGRLVPIVVAAPDRLKQLPDVPTFKEVGLEPVNRMAWYGVYGPKGLPIEIVNKLHSAIKKTLDQANVRARIEETASIVIGNAPEEFAQQIKAEYDIYNKVVQERQIKPE